MRGVLEAYENGAADIFRSLVLVPVVEDAMVMDTTLEVVVKGRGKREMKVVANKVVADKMVTNKVEVVADKVVANKVVADKMVANKVEVVADKVVANKVVANKAVANKAVTNKVVANKAVDNTVVANKVVANMVVAGVAFQCLTNFVMLDEEVVEVVLVVEPGLSLV